MHEVAVHEEEGVVLALHNYVTLPELIEKGERHGCVAETPSAPHNMAANARGAT